MPDSTNNFWRRHWRWLALGLYWLALFAGTSIPGAWLGWPRPRAGADKVAHFLAYAGLGLLLFLAKQAGSSRGALRTLAIVLLFICLYAAFDEWHQQFIPGRCMDRADFLADALGGAAGAAFGLAAHRLSSRFVSISS